MWCGSSVGDPNGIFGSGFWADSDHVRINSELILPYLWLDLSHKTCLTSTGSLTTPLIYLETPFLSENSNTDSEFSDRWVISNLISIPTSSRLWRTNRSSNFDVASPKVYFADVSCYTWKDSNAFMIHVPYATKIKDTKGNFKEVDQTYCETLQTSEQEKVLTVCDGMNGMARIFNANGGYFAMSTSPMSWNSKYQILSGVIFDTSSAIRGSVASWKAGDFNYNVRLFSERFLPNVGLHLSHKTCLRSAGLPKKPLIHVSRLYLFLHAVMLTPNSPIGRRSIRRPIEKW